MPFLKNENTLNYLKTIKLTSLFPEFFQLYNSDNSARSVSTYNSRKLLYNIICVKSTVKLKIVQNTLFFIFYVVIIYKNQKKY